VLDEVLARDCYPVVPGVGGIATIVDIGANVGFFSVYAANLARGGRVFSFEPVKANFDELMAYKKKYRLDNLMAQNIAIADAHKEVRIYVSAKNLGGHSFFKEAIASLEKENAEQYETVRCIPLKEVFDANNIATCDFLKIDVEGFEDSVLAGLSEPVPALSFEFTTIQRDVAEGCLQRLSTLGYGRFNVALGESQAMSFGAEISADAMRTFLAELPHEANSGDVYAIAR
jgi:FkbM family methyltransferase